MLRKKKKINKSRQDGLSTISQSSTCKYIFVKTGVKMEINKLQKDESHYENSSETSREQ